MPPDIIDAEAMQRSVDVANAVIRARSHRDRLKIANALVLFGSALVEDDRNACREFCKTLMAFLVEMDSDFSLLERHKQKRDFRG